MRWLDHLRGDAEACRDFIAFVEQQRAAAYEHFLNAKDMSGLERVKGRVDGMTALLAIVTEPDREAQDAADRIAQRERAKAGIRLAR